MIAWAVAILMCILLGETALSVVGIEWLNFLPKRPLSS